MTVKFSGHLLDVPCVLSASQECSTPTFKRTLRQWHPHSTEESPRLGGRGNAHKSSDSECSCLSTVPCRLPSEAQKAHSKTL